MPLPQYTPTPPKDPITEEKERIEKSVFSIRQRIGVHAGKGGVGKTFLATQLALLLAERGKNVGLIDADADCPNIPDALNIHTELSLAEDGKLIPAEHKKVKVVSTGFMQEEDTPIIIRGPIKHRLLTDFIEKTAWGELDTLIFDFPPGTSDVPLSAMQVANLTGIIFVTTSTPASIRDCTRAVNMAKKLRTPIVGIVENMSGEAFGQGEGETLATQLDIPFICRIPLSADIRKNAEQGNLALPKDVQEKLLRTLT